MTGQYFSDIAHKVLVPDSVVDPLNYLSQVFDAVMAGGTVIFENLPGSALITVRSGEIYFAYSTIDSTNDRKPPHSPRGRKEKQQ